MSKKKKKKQDKRNYYTPIGQYLNSETALVQSALMLDEAAHHALQLRDVESMSMVARGWMELGALLGQTTAEEGEEEDDGEVTSETTLGFRSAEAREVAENARKNKD